MCLNYTERRKLCASVCLARPSNISCGLALVKSQNASEEADSSPGCGIGMTVKGGCRPRGGVCVKTYPQGVFFVAAAFRPAHSFQQDARLKAASTRCKLGFSTLTSTRTTQLFNTEI